MALASKDGFHHSDGNSIGLMVTSIWYWVPIVGSIKLVEIDEQLVFMSHGLLVTFQLKLTYNDSSFWVSMVLQNAFAPILSVI